MTAIIGIRQSIPEPVVRIVTDGRGVGKNGEYFDIPKTLPLPTFPACLTAMGTSDSVPFLAVEICRRAETFAEAVAVLPTALRSMQEVRAECGDQGQQLAVLVGLDGTTPRIVVCATSADAGFEPWVTHDGGSFFVAPGATLKNLPNDTDLLNMDDMPNLLARVRDAQPERYRHLIGGAVTVTSVFTGRIEQRTVGRIAEPARVAAAPRRRLVNRVFGF